MPTALTSPPLRAGGLVALLDASQTPRSDLTTRRSGHQCIDAVSACTKRHYEEHAAHHREVSEERRSVSACGRRITYGPIVMENQCKGKRVKEKGESVVGVILVWWLRSVSDYSVLRRCALNECETENGRII